jgi:SAM-dependent methyltransferase
MAVRTDPARSIYESGEYLNRNPDWHVGESPWKAKQLVRMLNRNHVDPHTVCEIGCGAGEVLRQLQTRLDPTCELCGIDISPRAIDLCRPRANANLRFALGDAESIPDGSFDLVLVLDVMEHVRDYYGFLDAVHAKGHLTVFHIPLDLSAQTVLRPHGLLGPRDAYGHLHYFTRETALRALEDTGNRIVDWFYTPRAIEQPATELPRRLLRLPRKLLFSVHQDMAARALGGCSLMVLATAGER